MTKATQIKQINLIILANQMTCYNQDKIILQYFFPGSFSCMENKNVKVCCQNTGIEFFFFSLLNSKALLFIGMNFSEVILILKIKDEENYT